jgi:NTP pyrophosphatase (non-canonical NTP hydrolase)
MKELLELIKDLSLKDKKTLVEKVLKITEENGELADVVLAYNESPQSLHKISKEQDILEESIDIMLSAASVPLSLGFSFEQIGAMLLEKANYWQSLQNVEKDGKFLYEIHLYYDTRANFLLNKERFLKTCLENNIKTITTVTEFNNKKQRDIMTSVKFYGSYKGCLARVAEIRQILLSFKLSRTKIETMIHHPLGRTKGKFDNANFYFETHIQILIPNAQVSAKLKAFVRAFNNNGKELLHLSRNPFKKVKSGYIQMLNFRTRQSKQYFESIVSEIYNDLLIYEFQVLEKPEMELCILDTNESEKIF